MKFLGQMNIIFDTVFHFSYIKTVWDKELWKIMLPNSA